ncbi:MAG: hypothetical protein H3C27_08020 [Opitutaceae bacterium]|nr:hypothetical protein [Opitutaceae bacterium]
MSPFRIVALTLFAAFFGLFFVGFLRFRSIELLIYAAIFIDCAITLRKMKGHDEKSLAFQRNIEAKIKEMPWACSNQDFVKLLIMGMGAVTFLFLITLFGR